MFFNNIAWFLFSTGNVQFPQNCWNHTKRMYIMPLMYILLNIFEYKIVSRIHSNYYVYLRCESTTQNHEAPHKLHFLKRWRIVMLNTCRFSPTFTCKEVCVRKVHVQHIRKLYLHITSATMPQISIRIVAVIMSI